MTYFSIIIIVCLFAILARKQNPKTKFLNFLGFSFGIGINIQIGTFLKIGSFDISFGFMLEILVFIYSLIWTIKSNTKFREKEIIFLMIFSFCLFCSVILLLLNPYPYPIITRQLSWDSYVYGYISKENVQFSFFNIQEMLKPIMMAFIYLLVRKFSLQEKTFLINKTCSISKVFLCYGILEVFIKQIFHSDILYTIQQIIFGVAGATQNDLRQRGVLYSLQGLTKEPSHYAGLLFLLTLLLYTQQKLNNQSNKKWIILSMGLLLMSMSFSSVVWVGVLGLLWLIENKNKNSVVYKVVFVITIIFPIFMLTFEDGYFMIRIQNLLNDIPSIISGDWVNISNNDVSNRARMLSIWENIQIIMRRPLFGIGPGTTSALSETIMFIASNGLLVFFLWLKLVPLGERKLTGKYKFSIFVWIFASVFLIYESPFWTLPGMVTILSLTIIFNEPLLNIQSVYQKVVK